MGQQGGDLLPHEHNRGDKASHSGTDLHVAGHLAPFLAIGGPISLQRRISLGIIRFGRNPEDSDRDAREKKTRFSELRPTGPSPGKKVRRIELSEDAYRDIGFTQSEWGHFKVVVEEYG
jgi:hypothetical protein